MEKQDIREHSDQELSLLVFNDEYLYLRRHRSDFIELIKEMFIFTDEQLQVLIEDLEGDE